MAVHLGKHERTLLAFWVLPMSLIPYPAALIIQGVLFRDASAGLSVSAGDPSPDFPSWFRQECDLLRPGRRWLHSRSTRNAS